MECAHCGGKLHRKEPRNRLKQDGNETFYHGLQNPVCHAEAFKLYKRRRDGSITYQYGA